MRHTYTQTYSVLEIANNSFEDIAQRLYDAVGTSYFVDGKIVFGDVALVPESSNICDTCDTKYAPLPPTWKHDCGAAAPSSSVTPGGTTHRVAHKNICHGCVITALIAHHTFAILRHLGLSPEQPRAVGSPTEPAASPSTDNGGSDG